MIDQPIPTTGPVPGEDESITTQWRALLTGEDTALRDVRWFWKHVPSSPRCPGGAEIEISIVFADVRGSTGLAERISAVQYRGLIQAYYRAAAEAVDANGGIIDKFLGDGVMALIVPVITGVPGSSEVREVEIAGRTGRLEVVTSHALSTAAA